MSVLTLAALVRSAPGPGGYPSADYHPVARVKHGAHAPRQSSSCRAGCARSSVLIGIPGIVLDTQHDSRNFLQQTLCRLCGHFRRAPAPLFALPPARPRAFWCLFEVFWAVSVVFRVLLGWRRAAPPPQPLGSPAVHALWCSWPLFLSPASFLSRFSVVLSSPWFSPCFRGCLPLPARPGLWPPLLLS